MDDYFILVGDADEGAHVVKNKKLGPMARCAHCGVLSVDEAMACEMGDCQITNWHVPVEKQKQAEAPGQPEGRP